MPMSRSSRPRCDVEAIVTLGDLQPSWLETLDRVKLPKLGVYGNHDDEPYMTWFGIDDVHVNRIDLDNGVSFSGFEGCVSYRRSGTAKVGPSYTQRQAKKLIRKLPAADVLLCHCPPRGVNDDPDDPAHIGFEALRPWVLKHQPRWLLHGHTHPTPGQPAQPHRRHPRGLRQRRARDRPHLVSHGRATALRGHRLPPSSPPQPLRPWRHDEDAETAQEPPPSWAPP